MKTNRNLLVASIAAALFALASEASAQRMAPHVTASPKFQQQLDESRSVAPAKTLVTRTGDLVGGRQQPQIAHHAATANRIAASPKHRATLAERTSGTNSATSTGAGYKPTGADGITASPKLRQMLDESTPSFQLAPVK